MEWYPREFKKEKQAQEASKMDVVENGPVGPPRNSKNSWLTQSFHFHFSFSFSFLIDEISQPPDPY